MKGIAKNEWRHFPCAACVISGVTFLFSLVHQHGTDGPFSFELVSRARFDFSLSFLLFHGASFPFPSSSRLRALHRAPSDQTQLGAHRMVCKASIGAALRGVDHIPKKEM